MASKMCWEEQTYAAYRNFPFAPPDFAGAPYRSRVPQPPYAGAEGWKCSVYYYWWEYLRRHNGYKSACLDGGQHGYAQLYRWFGNVHQGDFAEWWWQNYWLFTFMSETQNIAQSSKFYLESEGVFLHVGYARSKSEMIASAREQIAKIPQRDINAELKKSIRFKPCARPVLKSLHQHLLAWDAKQAFPEKSDTELCDIAGIDISLPYAEAEIEKLHKDGLSVRDLRRANNRAKQLTVQRHLRIAQHYVSNVVLGEFPKRSNR